MFPVVLLRATARPGTRMEVPASQVSHAGGRTARDLVWLRFHSGRQRDQRSDRLVHVQRRHVHTRLLRTAGVWLVVAVPSGARRLHLPGLRNVLDAPHVPHSLSVQALSQDAPRVQAADGVLGYRLASG